MSVVLQLVIPERRAEPLAAGWRRRPTDGQVVILPCVRRERLAERQSDHPAPRYAMMQAEASS